MKLRVVPITDRESWNKYLEQTTAYDLYHTWLYHSLNEEGDPRLLVFEEGESLMLLPLVFREIPGTDWKDVTSVYGYAGWVCRQAVFSPQLFEMLEEYMRQEKVVSVFLRLHPLISGSDTFLKGTVKVMNTTTGIDLALPSDKQFMSYSASVRRSILKNRRQGLRVRRAGTLADLQHFIDVYRQAMGRIGADPHYFFSDSYFEQLWKSDSFETIVLLAEINGRVIAGAMFTICRGIMQYHLGGVDSSYVHCSPLKVLIDAAREWAMAANCSFFHLGGGYGGNDDQLFVFKSRMTTLRYEFKTLQWIVDRKRYDFLSSGKKMTGFFPTYRSIN